MSVNHCTTTFESIDIQITDVESCRIRQRVNGFFLRLEFVLTEPASLVLHRSRESTWLVRLMVVCPEHKPYL